jgi:hypothetical protein
MRTGKQQAGRKIRVAYGLDGDPATADVVRRIFTQFCDLYRRPSLPELAQSLNVDELPTQRGGRWHASTVHYILANLAYADLVEAELFDVAQNRLARLRPGPAR